MSLRDCILISVAFGGIIAGVFLPQAAEPLDGYPRISLMLMLFLSFLGLRTREMLHGVVRLRSRLLVTSAAQVAMARTFGFLRDVEALQSRGLALGGSLSNAVVLDERGVVNEEGLRAPDEFVRHKLLDFIGDMAMLPLPLMGRFTIRCSGHAVNNEFLRAIVAENGLQEVTLAPKAAPRRPKAAQTRPEARPEACPALAG